jgi:hypothetical protein
VDVTASLGASIYNHLVDFPPETGGLTDTDFSQTTSRQVIKESFALIEPVADPITRMHNDAVC